MNAYYENIRSNDLIALVQQLGEVVVWQYFPKFKYEGDTIIGIDGELKCVALVPLMSSITAPNLHNLAHYARVWTSREACIEEGLSSLSKNIDALRGYLEEDGESAIQMREFAADPKKEKSKRRYLGRAFKKEISIQINEYNIKVGLELMYELSQRLSMP